MSAIYFFRLSLYFFFSTLSILRSNILQRSLEIAVRLGMTVQQSVSTNLFVLLTFSITPQPFKPSALFYMLYFKALTYFQSLHFSSTSASQYYLSVGRQYSLCIYRDRYRLGILLLRKGPPRLLLNIQALSTLDRVSYYLCVAALQCLLLLNTFSATLYTQMRATYWRHYLSGPIYTSSIMPLRSLRPYSINMPLRRETLGCYLYRSLILYILRSIVIILVSFTLLLGYLLYSIIEGQRYYLTLIIFRFFRSVYSTRMYYLNSQLSLLLEIKAELHISTRRSCPVMPSWAITLGCSLQCRRLPLLYISSPIIYVYRLYYIAKLSFLATLSFFLASSFPLMEILALTSSLLNDLPLIMPVLTYLIRRIGLSNIIYLLRNTTISIKQESQVAIY